MMTPIHNLMITAAIANDGVMMTPYLVDHVQTADKIIVEQTTPTALATVATADEAEQLTQYMRAVVTQGTGYALKNASYKAVRRSMTALIMSIRGLSDLHRMMIRKLLSVLF